MSISNLLDFMAAKIDARKAQHTPFTMNIVLTDNNEIYFFELSNGNLNNGLMKKLQEADATLTLSKADVVNIVLSVAASYI